MVGDGGDAQEHLEGPAQSGSRSASPAPTFATTDVERLPARSLVVPPQPPVIRLSDLSEARRGIAA